MAPSARRAQHRRLIGRDRELDQLEAFLRRAAVHGESLWLSGAAGVGTTSLLNAAADVALDQGWTVLAGGGAEFEADLPFAVVHQLLLPLLPRPAREADPDISALLVAVGLARGAPPHVRQVAAGVLGLLRQVAETGPVLLIVDDLQWVDASSHAVLGLVADGLGRRAGLLAAARSQPDTLGAADDRPRLRVPPLDAEASGRVLDAHQAVMAAGVRRRVLAESAGFPLALVELPAALTDAQLADPRRLPAVLPLTDRLRAPFAAAVRDLPTRTGEILLLMAIGSGEPRTSVGRADRPADADLDPAVRAGLVSIDARTGQAYFRHPMARATVLEQSVEDDRRRAHRRLAEASVDQPDRRAWHLGQSTTAPDEQIAAMLDRAAANAERSGNAADAVDLLERAAGLTPASSDRARRLALAGYLAARVTGELGRARALLADAGRAHPRARSSLEIAVGTAFVELAGSGEVDGAYGLLVAAVQDYQGSAADPVFVEALHNLLDVCLAGAHPQRFRHLAHQLSRVSAQVAPELVLRAQLLSDAAAVPIDSLRALDRSIEVIRTETDPTRIERIAALALSVDRLTDCREPLWRLVHDGRTGGAITAAIGAFALLAQGGFRNGRWDEADRLAREGIALGESHGYQLAGWPLHHTIAMLAAARGDDSVLAEETEAMDLWAGPRGAGAVQADARRARALGALGLGDFERAYRLLATDGTAGTVGSNIGQAVSVIFDLVEAAVGTDRVPEGMNHLSAIRRSDVAGCSPRLALLVEGATAMVSSGPEFRDRFDNAVTVPGVDRWPFDLARVRLAYGARLRRAHAMVQARVQLAAALDLFSGLGAQPWAVRAETELLATGMTRSTKGGVGPGSLTHQERAVAELAAAGLTNKQIAQRMSISPRTVGAHLRQIFPKLGITSRASIGDAMRFDAPRVPG